MASVVSNLRPPEYRSAYQALKITGFWVFLATDMLLFGCLFATYLVLRTHTDGGPAPLQIFNIPGFTLETFFLLTSSFTGGIATWTMRSGRQKQTVSWMLVTIMFGLAFILLEATEFAHDVTIGATIGRSAFLSAFFTLVGTHGSHVSIGLVWMFLTMLQVLKHGITPQTARKVFVVNLYWHFLDVVWVFIFTVVYLSGVVLS